MTHRILPLAAHLALCVVLSACSAPPRADANLKQIPVTATGATGATTKTAAAAGVGEGAVAAAASTDAAAPVRPPGYALMLGDEFDVRILDAPQYDQTVKVRPDGKVNLSVIGSVYVAGRSPEDVEGELRERYAAAAGSMQQREYLIHDNDELEIKFPFYPQFNDQMRVRPDGKITLQLAGTVQAQGLSPEEVERELRRRYAHYLKDPELSVIVRTATSQTVRTANGMGRGGLAGLQPTISVRSFQVPQVYFAGEVGRPGLIPYTPGMTLLQALSEAGGNLPSGDVTKLVILRKSAGQTADLVRPHLSKTFREAPTEDVVLQPYDVVVLPPTHAQNVAEWLDRYVYKLFAPLKNSSFSYVYSRATTVY
jgi:polysaccharide export outer membrane protein